MHDDLHPFPAEVSLDPHDWVAFRKLAHEMVDTMINQFQGLADRPVWQPPPDEVIQQIRNDPLPKVGVGEQKVWERFCQLCLPYPNGSWHPRFFGWVQATGMPLAMMSDMLASGLNTHMAGFHTAPKWIELQVIRWVAEMLGWPSDASGLLTSGGSMANLLALVVARNSKAPWDIRQSGIAGSGNPVMMFYASHQTHGWLEKAAELMGHGRVSIHWIETRADGRICMQGLKAALQRDRDLGRLPIGVCANAGTVNTGAIDPLDEIADLCAEQDLWFHIDGAFGALAYLVESFQDKLSGMQRADSLAVDLHKWMFLPFDIGCLLVKDEKLHLASFATSQAYMQDTERGLLAGGVPFSDRGIELTRPFRALKAWMCLSAYGTQRFSECIRNNLSQAAEFKQCIERAPNLELMAPVPLNIVCFRYLPRGQHEIDRFNQELLLRLQESGVAVLSSTWLNHRLALRAAITNHRTRREDIYRTVQIVLELGKQLEEDFE